jgi:hypothetical protein
MMLYFWQGSRLALLQNARKCGLKHGGLAQRSSHRSMDHILQGASRAAMSTAAHRYSVVMSHLPASPSAARLVTYYTHACCMGCARLCLP